MQKLLGSGRRLRLKRSLLSVVVLVPLALSVRASSPQLVHPTAVAATGAQAFGFGDAHAFGALTSLAAPIIGLAATPSGAGYILAATDGGVFTFGDAAFRGSMGGRALAAPVVGTAMTPSGGGYYLAASDGGVFAFGDAAFRGSMAGRALAAPIVGMAVTPSGRGYYLAASDGGVFTFGDAMFRGSTGGQRITSPVVAITATASGNGYYLAASDGGVFAFGDAMFRGSMGGKALAAPITAVAATRSGGGYYLVGADGGVFAFGDALYRGSPGPSSAPIVAMSVTANGYLLAGQIAPTPLAVPAGFPTTVSAGVPTGTSLNSWAWELRTSAAAGLPTEIHNGMTCVVFDGYVLSMSGGQYLSVDSPCVVLRRSRVTTSGQVSNSSAIVQPTSANRFLLVDHSDFDGGPSHNRGIQGDYSDITVSQSKFTRFGNAGIEMNNRSGTASLTVEDSYFYEPKGWNPADHVDGIQVGAGGNVTIRHNTVLIEPFGGTAGDTSYVSNSALGLWAELGDVTGAVVVDHNLLAGGGFVVYLEQKSPYRWLGPVSVTNNVFDTRFGPNSGLWGTLYPTGLPSQLAWSGNTSSNGTAVAR
jgi:hypothetical protein